MVISYKVRANLFRDLNIHLSKLTLSVLERSVRYSDVMLIDRSKFSVFINPNFFSLIFLPAVVMGSDRTYIAYLQEFLPSDSYGGHESLVKLRFLRFDPWAACIYPDHIIRCWHLRLTTVRLADDMSFKSDWDLLL